MPLPFPWESHLQTAKRMGSRTDRGVSGSSLNQRASRDWDWGEGEQRKRKEGPCWVEKIPRAECPQGLVRHMSQEGGTAPADKSR